MKKLILECMMAVGRAGGQDEWTDGCERDRGFRVRATGDRGHDALGGLIPVMKTKAILVSLLVAAVAAVCGADELVLAEREKPAAALQLLRTMNPDILAMDEITDPRDAQACRAAAGCGVALLSTAHGDDTSCTPVCRELLAEGVFSRCIRIRRTARGREYRVEVPA